MYKAIRQFTDLQDNNHAYYPGDTFPRKGLTVSEERLEELSTDKNRRHTPMIQLVESPKKAETPEKVEIPEDRPKKPETGKKEAVAKPRRGRKKKADAE